MPGVRPVKPTDPVMQALLRKRVEIYTWLDSPAKQAHLAKINRMIEERRNSVQAARGQPPIFTPEGSAR